MAQSTQQDLAHSIRPKLIPKNEIPVAVSRHRSSCEIPAVLKLRCLKRLDQDFHRRRLVPFRVQANDIHHDLGVSRPKKHEQRNLDFHVRLPEDENRPPVPPTTSRHIPPTLSSTCASKQTNRQIDHEPRLLSVKDPRCVIGAPKIRRPCSVGET